MKLIITILSLILINFEVISDEIKPDYENGRCYLSLPENNQFLDSLKIVKDCKQGNMMTVIEVIETLKPVEARNYVAMASMMIDTFVGYACDINKQILIKYPYIGNLHSSVHCVYNGLKE